MTFSTVDMSYGKYQVIETFLVKCRYMAFCLLHSSNFEFKLFILVLFTCLISVVVVSDVIVVVSALVEVIKLVRLNQIVPLGWLYFQCTKWLVYECLVSDAEPVARETGG